jgi:hypothetical protein
MAPDSQYGVKWPFSIAKSTEMYKLLFGEIRSDKQKSKWRPKWKIWVFKFKMAALKPWINVFFLQNGDLMQDVVSCNKCMKICSQTVNLTL